MLPLGLKIKLSLIGTPLEPIAHKVKWLLGAPHRMRHPELWDIYLESRRIELAVKKLLRPDSNCVDVGCHIGSFLALLIKVAPNGRHAAVEASPAKAAALKARYPKVRIHDCAVGETESCATFYEDLARPGFSSLHRSTADRHIKREITVAIKRLDDLLCREERIDFVKLDIEGGELAALRGAQKTLQRHRPALLFECVPESQLKAIGVSRRELFDFLNEEHYQIYTLTDFLFSRPPLDFSEFHRCGLYPVRALNFVALPSAC